MNRYVTFLPIAILILGGTGIVSQAFAATVMTLETDNQIYDHASTIILTGNVFPVDLRGSEVTVVCKSPGGAGVCGIQQVQPNSDGDFSVMFNTSSSLFRPTWYMPQIPVPPGLLHIMVTSEPLKSIGSTLPVRIIVEAWS